MNAAVAFDAMSLDPEYLAGVAQPPTADFYMLLFSPRGRREDARTLLALERLINELSVQHMEPEVRQAKLAWWAGEFARLDEGAPAHPVTIAVAEVLARNALSPAPLLAVFSAVVREASDALPDNPEELLQHAADRGALMPVLAAVLANKGQLSSQVQRACSQIGAARFIARIFGTQHRAHASEQMAGADGAATGMGLEVRLAQSQLESLREGLQSIPVAQRPDLVPALVMAALLTDALQEITANGPHSKPTNLRPLLRAWRSARRASRGKLPA